MSDWLAFHLEQCRFSRAVHNDRDRDRDREADETQSGSVERSEIEPGP